MGSDGKCSVNGSPQHHGTEEGRHVLGRRETYFKRSQPPLPASRTRQTTGFANSTRRARPAPPPCPCPNGPNLWVLAPAQPARGLASPGRSEGSSPTIEGVMPRFTTSAGATLTHNDHGPPPPASNDLPGLDDPTGRPGRRRTRCRGPTPPLSRRRRRRRGRHHGRRIGHGWPHLRPSPSPVLSSSSRSSR